VSKIVCRNTRRALWAAAWPRSAESGFPLAVYNRTVAKLNHLSRTARVLRKSSDAAKGAAVIVSMLSDDSARASMDRPQGALAAAILGGVSRMQHCQSRMDQRTCGQGSARNLDYYSTLRLLAAGYRPRLLNFYFWLASEAALLTATPDYSNE